MALRRPLAFNTTTGEIEEIPTGDQVNAAYVSDTEGQIMTNTSATTAINAGAPVYVKTDGTIDLANNSTYDNVYGMTVGQIAASGTGLVKSSGDTVTVADWTNVAGAASLTIGATYYLGSTAGTITSTVPAEGSNQYVITVGVARSANDLRLDFDRVMYRPV